MNKIRRVMITGSFDPPTLGHMDVIERTSKMFDHVVVCICENSEKRYMFSLEERTAMLADCCMHLDNVSVDVCHGLVADYAKENSIDAIVKGVRNGTDFEYECMLDEVNRSIYEAPSIFIPAAPEYRHLSSTVGREMIKYNKELQKFLPEAVIKHLKK